MLNFAKKRIDIDALKGTGWQAGDNLHEIMQALYFLGAGVSDMVVAANTTITGDRVVNDLYVCNGALLTVSGTLTVRGDCHVKSGRITAGALVVEGNLSLVRELGDTSYTNLLTITNGVDVHGDCWLAYTSWSMATLRVEGDVIVAGSCGRMLDWWIGGNLEDDRATISHVNEGQSNAQAGYSGTPLVLRVDGGISWPNLTQISTYGSWGGNYGGNGGDVTISVGAAITLGHNLLLAAYGGNTVTYTGGNGGDCAVRYAALSGGTLTANVAGGTGPTPGAAGTTDIASGAPLAGHHPHLPAQITEEGAESALLSWAVPDDANDEDLGFLVEVGSELSAWVIDLLIYSDSNSHPSEFGGDGPWSPGEGVVEYPLSLPAGEYRWRVTAFKYTDMANLSISSPWRTVVVGG